MDKVVAAFTEDQVEKLTGVSVGQLRYWDRTGFFAPAFAEADRRLSYSRIYSFRDVVCLKVLNDIRNVKKVSLPHMRGVKNRLMADFGNDLWAKLKLYVLKRRIIFVNPETEKPEEVVSGQYVLEIPLQVVTGNMEREVKRLQQRDKQTIGQVKRQRNVANNKPVVAGTRIPVAAIKAFGEAGYTVRQIRKEYPVLTEADIKAALRHDLAA